MNYRTLMLAAVLGTAVGILGVSREAEGRVRFEEKCTWGLNTTFVPTHCEAGQTFLCEGVECCHHEHQALSYNSLIDTGTTTNKKAGVSQKIYYHYKKYMCDDHDDDPGTSNTCEWPFPAQSQDGPAHNPTHFVTDWSLTDC